MDHQNYLLAQFLYLSFRYSQAHEFLWTTKYQSGLLWWLVNQYDNWAFNMWTVYFINFHCNMLLFFFLGCVCIVTGWSIHSHPTHQVIQPITDFSYLLICMCISARQNLLANQICVYTTCISCSICWTASSPMEGKSGQVNPISYLPSFGN